MSATTPPPRFPPSPASPPDTGLQRSESKSYHTVTTIQSPISPPFMSVATKSYVSSYGNNHHTDEMAQRPRSPVTNYVSQQQRMNPPTSSAESSLKRSSPIGDENEHRNKRQKLEVEEQGERMEIDTPLAPTNHQRQGNSINKESQHESSKTNEDELRQDAGDLSSQRFSTTSDKAYLLCRSSLSRSRPDPKQHLLATYGLTDLLKSVARTDPLTGEKINKLRKSYEGQIKTFGLAGRNKPVKVDREEDEPGPLRSLAMIQDNKWDEDQGISKIEIDEGFRSKMQRALQIQPGTVRNNAHWEDVLGLEKPRFITQPLSAPAVTRIPNGFPRSQPGPIAADKRSTRGNKRSYGDNSFDGYGDGYSDAEDAGADDGDYAAQKRRKV